MYEIFEHTADLGLRIRAPSLEQLFADAGRALFSVIVAHLDAVRPIERREFAVEGNQREYLLVDWLDELLFTFETQRLVFVEFDVRIDDDGLQATARGEPFDPDRHGAAHEVKAITYHALKLERRPDGWLAEVIVDI